MGTIGWFPILLITEEGSWNFMGIELQVLQAMFNIKDNIKVLDVSFFLNSITYLYKWLNIKKWYVFVIINQLNCA